MITILNKAEFIAEIEATVATASLRTAQDLETAGTAELVERIEGGHGSIRRVRTGALRDSYRGNENTLIERQQSGDSVSWSRASTLDYASKIEYGESSIAAGFHVRDTQMHLQQIAPAIFDSAIQVVA